MIKNKPSRVGFALLVLVWGFLIPSQGHATQVQQVETEGSIGFIGVYEPIGSPEPSPPDTIARPPSNTPIKPGGRLPQTNDPGQNWLQWLGMSLLLLGLWLVMRRKKQKKQLNKTI